jgi:hypothetical protein
MSKSRLFFHTIDAPVRIKRLRPRLAVVSLATHIFHGAVQFNCILFHSTDPMAQFGIGHIGGSVAHCRTPRGYCPEPCRLSK